MHALCRGSMTEHGETINGAEVKQKTTILKKETFVRKKSYKITFFDVMQTCSRFFFPIFVLLIIENGNILAYFCSIN